MRSTVQSVCQGVDQYMLCILYRRVSSLGLDGGALTKTSAHC